MTVELHRLLDQQPHVTSVIKQIVGDGSRNHQISLLKALNRSQTPSAYRRQVLHRLVIECERQGRCVADDIELEYARLSVLPKLELQMGLSAVHYHFGVGEVLIEEDRSLLAQAGGTGYRTWEAALVLSEYLIASSCGATAAGTSRVLELGAGTGLVGLVLSKLGYDVTLTDGDPIVVERLKKTVRLNGLTARVEQLVWSSPNDVCRANEYDVLVAADVLYDPTSVPSFVRTIKSSLRPGSGAAFVSTTLRQEATYELFLQTCSREQLTRTRLQSPAVNHFFVPSSACVVVDRIELPKMPDAREDPDPASQSRNSTY